MKPIVDFLAHWWGLGAFTGVVSLGLMIGFGNWWQSTGKIDRERVTFLIGLSRFFAVTMVISFVTFGLSLIILFLRAVL